MATTVSTVNSLLGLTNEELISTSINFIDSASNNALKNCFDNLFKEAIMKYVLKIVIPQEIHQLSTTTKSDWQRVSLIQKLSTLHETHKTETKSVVPNTLDSKSSTHYLLTSGFMRNELIVNESTQNLSHDIVFICQRFVGAAPYNPLVIFNHESQTYRTISDDSNLKPIAHATKQTLPQFLSTVSSKESQMKLIKPNKMLSFDSQSQSAFYCDSLPPFPISSDICVNIQSTRKNIQPQHQGNYMYMSPPMDGMNSRAAVQYFDAERFEVLQLGGVSTRSVTSPYGGIGGPTSDVTYRESVMNDTIHRYQMNKDVKETNWVEAGNLIHGRASMSLCNVNKTRLAIIGGSEQISVYTLVPLDSVELYDLTDNNAVNVSLTSMNCARIECGSSYNDKSNQIVVFGGSGESITSMHRGNRNEANVSRSMEIYDIHKNKWFDVPYKSKNKYRKYPCIWTMGSQCIFVSQIVDTPKPPTIQLHLDNGLRRSFVESEWIDLRVCDRNGTNKATFNAMDPVELDPIPIESSDVPHSSYPPQYLANPNPVNYNQPHIESSWLLSMFVHYPT
eukprot:386369_1